MAIDKGYTKAFFQAAGRIAGKGEEFNAFDCKIGHNQGMITRGIRYGIIERVSSGRYRMLVDEPWRAYKVAAKQSAARRSKLIPAVVNGSAGPKHHQPTGPDVKIVPYGDYELVVIGKRIFLATEVQLTPRRQHGS